MPTTVTPISDELLERVLTISEEARAGRADPCASTLLLHLAPELLRELRDLRKFVVPRAHFVARQDDDRPKGFHGAEAVAKIVQFETKRASNANAQPEPQGAA